MNSFTTVVITFISKEHILYFDFFAAVSSGVKMILLSEEFVKFVGIGEVDVKYEKGVLCKWQCDISVTNALIASYKKWTLMIYPSFQKVLRSTYVIRL